MNIETREEKSSTIEKFRSSIELKHKTTTTNQKNSDNAMITVRISSKVKNTERKKPNVHTNHRLVKTFGKQPDYLETVVLLSFQTQNSTRTVSSHEYRTS